MYKLTITYADKTVITYPATFLQLSRQIDAAWKAEGFQGYVVGPG